MSKYTTMASGLGLPRQTEQDTQDKQVRTERKHGLLGGTTL